MIAIEITPQNKALNPDLLKGDIGSIQVLRNIPKTYFSENYRSGYLSYGYNLLDVSVWQSDGFYPLVMPSFDINLKKLGSLVFGIDEKFTYTLVDLTTQEIADKLQETEDSDNSSLINQKYKEDGVKSFDRAFALIHRRFDKGVITANQAKALANGLYPVLEPLYKGQWRLVKINLGLETPPSNAKLLDIFNLILNKVNSYVSENY